MMYSSQDVYYNQKKIYMKKLILPVLLFISLSTFAQTDNETTNESPVNQILTHGVGFSYQEFNGLNGRIANFPQYKKLRNHTGTLQIGLLKERKGLMSGLGFGVGSSMSGDRDKKSSTIRFFGFSADIGYNFSKNQRVMIYPLVGLGVERYQARFFKDNSGVQFNDVLANVGEQNNIRPVDFTNTFFNYRAGFGLILRSARKPTHSIGLQAGYTGSFKDKAWRSQNDQVLANSPEDKLSRFYATLSLNMHGFTRKKYHH
jgi:hypothetical protein